MVVAQLVESRIVIPFVVGSSPISHPKKMQALVNLLENRPFKGLFFFVRLNLLPGRSFVH